jgi:nitric oxide reductase NorQ protein
MSYAILITGQTTELDTHKQILIANHNGKNFAWTRKTNGGRGETNAWFDNDYVDVIATATSSHIVGEVLSSPLSDVDVNAIESGERPTVLIQKLTKQFGLRHKNIDSTKTIADVLVDVDYILKNNPQDLDKYRSDGRKDKSVTATKTPAPIAPAPIIQVVREEAKQDVVGGYSINVPTKEFIGHYIERTLVGDVKERVMYDTAKKLKLNVLLEGGAGSGKTSSPIFYGYRENQGVVVVSMSAGIEVGHFVGKTIIKNDGQVGWIDGVLVQAMKRGDILVIDELDFATPKIMQRLQDVLANRTLTLVENEGEVVYAHPDFLVVATYNNGYRGSQKVNQAVLDRFKIKLMFDYDTTIEKQLIKSPTLLQLAEQMRADSIQGIYETPISLRLLLAFQDLATEINYAFAVENFLMGFTVDERPSVKLLLEAHRYNLEQELTGVSA